MAKKVKTGPMVACPTCKTPNPMGSVFCISCGDRLYKEGAQAEIVNFKKVGGPAKAIFNAFRALVLLVLISILALLIWPHELDALTNNAGALAAGQRNIRLVSSQVRSQTPSRNVFTQDQINSVLKHFGEKAQEQEDWGSYTKRSSEDARVIFDGENHGVLTFLERWGAVPLSLRVEFEIDPKAKTWETSALWHGHFPLPVKFAPRLVQSAAERYGLDAHVDLMRSVRPLASKKNAVALETIVGAKLLKQETDANAR